MILSRHSIGPRCLHPRENQPQAKERPLGNILLLTSQLNCLQARRPLLSVRADFYDLAYDSQRICDFIIQRMKSLLRKVTKGNLLHKRPSRNIPRRAGTPGPGYESSSGGESTAADIDGYRSGALNSDKDLRNFETSSEANPPTISASRILDTKTTNSDPTRVLTQNSCNSYSSGDYRPLAFLAQAHSPVTVVTSPARKRRRMLCKPSKVMKDAYFEGIQWTRTFVSMPLDPIHNRYKFYCQICKANVSIYSKEVRENLRHYKTEGHLRRD